MTFAGSLFALERQGSGEVHQVGDLRFSSDHDPCIANRAHNLANMDDNKEQFEISLIGNVTGEKWVGKFAAKRRLSHKDFLKTDLVYRELIGTASPDKAALGVRNVAGVFSQLTVRLVDAPKWWTELDGGLDMEDDNVIAEVYRLTMKVEADAVEARAAKVAEATKGLRAIEADEAAK